MDRYPWTQASKKKVREEVRRQRQRRTIISLVVVAILIGTIGYAVYALTQSKGDGNFPFPCLAEITTVHVHPWLQIVVNTGTNNATVQIPAAIGILDPQFNTAGVAIGGSCFEPMHTHDASGIIHVEAASVSNQYTLDAFFTIWNVTYPNGDPLHVVYRSIHFKVTYILGLYYVTLSLTSIRPGRSKNPFTKMAYELSPGTLGARGDQEDGGRTCSRTDHCQSLVDACA